jgi:cytochrome b involved in lipid metabolism
MKKYFKWKEIRESDNLIVIDEFVYDVTNFKKKHPGGEEIIKNHISQDASVIL